MGRPDLPEILPDAHPFPPADLSERSLPTRDMIAPWFRIYHCDLSPVYFGTTGRYRYDASDGQFGVLYAGRDRLCALMETIGTLRGPGAAL